MASPANIDHDITPAVSGYNLGSSVQRWNAYLQNVSVAGTFNGAIYVSAQSGATAGAKIIAALATVPVTGGLVIVDLSGPQSITSPITVPSSTTLYFYNGANYTFSATGSFTLSSGSSLIADTSGNLTGGSIGVLFTCNTAALSPVNIASGAAGACISGISFNGTSRTNALGAAITFAGSNTFCLIEKVQILSWMSDGITLGTGCLYNEFSNIFMQSTGATSGSHACISVSGNAAHNSFSQIILIDCYYAGVDEKGIGTSSKYTNVHISASSGKCFIISGSPLAIAVSDFFFSGDISGNTIVYLVGACIDPTFSNGEIIPAAVGAGVGISTQAAATRVKFSNVTISSCSIGIVDAGPANTNSYVAITLTNNTVDTNFTNNQLLLRTNGTLNLGAYAHASLPTTTIPGTMARVSDGSRGLWMYSQPPSQWFSLNGETFNVAEFGAVGDGVADDTAEIQAAITAAQTNGGGIVLLPPGTYLLSSALTVTVGNISIVGSGWGTTLSSTTVNKFIDIGAGISNVIVSNLRITSSAAATAPSADVGAIHVGTATTTDCVIDRVKIDTVGTCGVVLYGTGHEVTNCHIKGVGQHGIYGTSAGTVGGIWNISNNLIETVAIASVHTGTAGIKIDTGSSGGLVTVANNIVSNFKDVGIMLVQAASGVNCAANSMAVFNASNTAYDVRTPGAYVTGGYVVAVSGPLASSFVMTITAGASLAIIDGIAVAGAWSTTLFSFSGAATYVTLRNLVLPVTLTGATSCISLNGAGTGCEVANSFMDAGAATCISLGNAANPVIQSNRLVAATGTGVNLGSSSAARLWNNEVRDTTTAYTVSTATTYGVTPYAGPLGATATAASALDLTAFPHAQYFLVGGNTNIDSILGGWTGRICTFRMSGTPTWNDGAPLLLAGNFVAGADDTITLVATSSTVWAELARSAN